MTLRIANRMYAVTSSGEREIQLCVGDITALPVEEKVDVILVSAFPNNYSATAGSVLGALMNKLHVNVEDLAYNHQKEDLRKHFHCWISKELPQHVPYRQLICFEQKNPVAKAGQPLDNAINDIFRAMMPAFNNENKSVITPLLATGSQSVQKARMLRLMLNASIDWMKFGLPLQLLKIVIYKVSEESMKNLESVFDEIKSRVDLDRSIPKDPPRRYDAFLIYAKDDADIASEVKNYLTSSKRRFMKYLHDANIITVSNVATKNSSWRHDVITAMLASTSVVPLLTTSFLADSSCLDQYNLALCANRRTQRNLLAPFCLDLLPDLPIYMTLVQWFNCRPRDKTKVQNACIVLTEQMKESFESRPVQYDVFLSYCHRNVNNAKLIVNDLKRKRPEIRVFFDQDELKTGQSWQQAIYRAVDSSKCVVALLSHDYMESLVCNEELNLSTAKHLSTAKNQELILITLEELKPIPLFGYIRPIEGEGHFKRVAGSVSDSIVDWLNTGNKDAAFSSVEYPLDIQAITEQWRRHDFERNYVLNHDGVYLAETAYGKGGPKRHDYDNGKSSSEQEKAPINDIFISSALQDRRYASLLAWALARSPAGFSVCNFAGASESNETAEIDTARVVVVLLSLQYHRNPRKIEELSYVLSRARRCCRTVYAVVVDALPTRPWYMRVVHCNTSLVDDFWPDALASLTNSSKDGTIFNAEIQSVRTKIEKLHGPLMSREVLALLKAACDIEDVCIAARNGKEPAVQMQKNIFFNIVDLKHSTEAKSTDDTRKSGSEVVSGGYGSRRRDEKPASGKKNRATYSEKNEMRENHDERRKSETGISAYSSPHGRKSSFDVNDRILGDDAPARTVASSSRGDDDIGSDRWPERRPSIDHERRLNDSVENEPVTAGYESDDVDPEMRFGGVRGDDSDVEEARPRGDLGNRSHSNLRATRSPESPRDVGNHLQPIVAPSPHQPSENVDDQLHPNVVATRSPESPHDLGNQLQPDVATISPEPTHDVGNQLQPVVATSAHQPSENVSHQLHPDVAPISCESPHVADNQFHPIVTTISPEPTHDIDHQLHPDVATIPPEPTHDIGNQLEPVVATSPHQPPHDVDNQLHPDVATSPPRSPAGQDNQQHARMLATDLIRNRSNDFDHRGRYDRADDPYYQMNQTVAARTNRGNPRGRTCTVL